MLLGRKTIPGCLPVRGMSLFEAGTGRKSSAPNALSNLSVANFPKKRRPAELFELSSRLDFADVRNHTELVVDHLVVETPDTSKGFWFQDIEVFQNFRSDAFRCVFVDMPQEVNMNLAEGISVFVYPNKPCRLGMSR